MSGTSIIGKLFTSLTYHPNRICKQLPMPDVLGFCMGQKKEAFDMEASNRKG